MSAMYTPGYYLNEVTLEDLTSYSGATGVWSGSHEGTRTGQALPEVLAARAQFIIARRYRGGRPGCYVPPGSENDLATQATWTGTYTSALVTALEGFFGAVLVLSTPSCTPTQHVNLSYYQGFTNVTNSSGRTRAAPKYRVTPVIDTIVTIAAGAYVSTQKRRLKSTTP